MYFVRAPCTAPRRLPLSPLPRSAPVHQVTTPPHTEKKPLTSWAMPLKAARCESSWGRQQQSRRRRLSHTRTASERAVDRNWAPSLLSRSRRPCCSASAVRRWLPNGSNTTSTPTTVKKMRIQLRRQTEKKKFRGRVGHTRPIH